MVGLGLGEGDVYLFVSFCFNNLKGKYVLLELIRIVLILLELGLKWILCWKS